jgi:hypothetical protein
MAVTSGYVLRSSFRYRDGGKYRTSSRCAGVGCASAEGPFVATGITQAAGNDTFRI